MWEPAADAARAIDEANTTDTLGAGVAGANFRARLDWHQGQPRGSVHVLQVKVTACWALDIEQPGKQPWTQSHVMGPVPQVWGTHCTVRAPPSRTKQT
jgi:hypothetical protein